MIRGTPSSRTARYGCSMAGSWKRTSNRPRTEHAENRLLTRAALIGAATGVPSGSGAVSQDTSGLLVRRVRALHRGGRDDCNAEGNKCNAAGPGGRRFAGHVMVPRGANLENVKLINGGLSLSGMTGAVKASSVNGSIKAERMEGQVELSTVNGFLDAGFQRISKGHPISLGSVNGPIKVSLPSGARANVSAHNLSGGIDADFGRAWRAPSGHRLEAAVNGGGTQIRVHNVNGGISIHANWNRRSPHPIS